MYVFLAIIIVLASLLLIGAVLIQKSKGGGLASNYAGGNQYMGYRKTTDFIEKATWTLAIVICVLSICCSFTLKGGKEVKSAITPVTQEAPAPGAGQAATATPAPKAEPKAETKAEAGDAAQTQAPAVQAEAPAAQGGE